MEARVARFYPGIDPYGTPMWRLESLNRCIPLLRAEEKLWQTDAVRLAGARQSDYEQGVRRLRNMAKPIDPRKLVVFVADERLAAWFEREIGGGEVEIRIKE